MLFRRLIGLSFALIVAGPARGSEVSDAIRGRVDACLKELAEDGSFGLAAGTLDIIFDQVIAYADESDADLFAEVAFHRRLVRQLSQAGAGDQRDRLAYLLDHADLARTLAFAIKPPDDDPEQVYAMLDRLRAHRGSDLGRYAGLAAAICVVHDVPRFMQINENRAHAPDPPALFDYFVANESKMLFGVENVPAELLVYVVDAAASLEEMDWALKNYAGDRGVGSRFFDIEYDFDYLQGRPKKVNLAGWNLPNIRKHGGICADQAYFAVTVGKSIGVPTAYTVGVGSDVAHAWVGFLETDGRRAWWNFDTGRYPAYQGVRGVVRDPQTGRRIPDSYIKLLADFVTAPAEKRRHAAAFTDAAVRLHELREAGGGLDVPSPTGETATARRSTTTDDQLALLRAGLEACAGYAPGWFAVRAMGDAGYLSYEDKERWATFLGRLCGQWYPDFYFVILKPMIETVEDARRQNTLWNKAFQAFRARADLAAAVRMEQAQLWLAQGKPKKAGQCYEDVINRYGNVGRSVRVAVREAEKLLRDAGDHRQVVRLYEHAWSQTRPPEGTGVFSNHSNWFYLGKAYAERLDEAGRGAEAARVRQRIGMK